MKEICTQAFALLNRRIHEMESGITNSFLMVNDQYKVMYNIESVVFDYPDFCLPVLEDALKRLHDAFNGFESNVDPEHQMNLEFHGEWDPITHYLLEEVSEYGKRLENLIKTLSKSSFKDESNIEYSTNPLAFLEYFYYDIDIHPESFSYIIKNNLPNDEKYSGGHGGVLDYGTRLIDKQEYYIRFVSSNFYDSALIDIYEIVSEEPEKLQTYLNQLKYFIRLFDKGRKFYLQSCMRDIAINMLLELSMKYGKKLTLTDVNYDYLLGNFNNINREINEHKNSHLVSFFKAKGNIVKNKHITKFSDIFLLDKAFEDNSFDKLIELILIYNVSRLEDRVEKYLICLVDDDAAIFITKLSDKLQDIYDSIPERNTLHNKLLSDFVLSIPDHKITRKTIKPYLKNLDSPHTTETQTATENNPAPSLEEELKTIQVDYFKWLGKKSELQSLYDLLTKQKLISTDPKIFKKAFSGKKLKSPLCIEWLKKPSRGKHPVSPSSLYSLLFALERHNKVEIKSINSSELNNTIRFIFCFPAGDRFQKKHMRGYKREADNNDKIKDFYNLLMPLFTKSTT